MRNSLKESPTSIKLMIYIVVGIKTIQGTTYIKEAPWKYGLDFEQAESGRKVAEGGVILILELLVITKPTDIMSSGHNIKGGYGRTGISIMLILPGVNVSSLITKELKDVILELWMTSHIHIQNFVTSSHSPFTLGWEIDYSYVTPVLACIWYVFEIRSFVRIRISILMFSRVCTFVLGACTWYIR